jgi:hypothetical protein
MEEILILLVQIAVEIAAQVFFFYPFETIAWQRDDSGSPNGCGWFLISCAFGGARGGLSTLVAPNLLLPHAALRGLNLLLSPLIVGGLAAWLARGRKEIGHKIEPTHFFWLGLVFSLSFTLLRWAFGAR